MEEQVDIYDPQGNPTGLTTSKLNAHIKGLWHTSAHIWIYDSFGRILLQKRAACKETFPSLWDISVAGHVDAGETPLMGALREIKEEIGMDADAGELEYIATIRMEYPYPARGWMNREHCHIFLWKKDLCTEHLSLQSEEVEQVKYFTVEELKEMTFASRGVLVPHENYYDFIIDTIVKKHI